MSNSVDQEIQNEDGIRTTHLYGSNTSFIKHFNGEKIPNSIQEIIKIYKEFI